MAEYVTVLLIGGPAAGRTLRIDLKQARPWVFVTDEADVLSPAWQHPATRPADDGRVWHYYRLDPERPDLRDVPPLPGEVPHFIAAAF